MTDPECKLCKVSRMIEYPTDDTRSFGMGSMGATRARAETEGFIAHFHGISDL